VASALSQGATVVHYELSDLKDLTIPAEVSMAFHAPEYANRQGDVILFDLFGNPLRWATHGFFPALPQVKYAIELPPQGKADMILKMELPEQVKVGYLPSPVLVDNPYYRIEMVPRTDKHQITWEISTEIKANRVSTEDYGIVREGFQNIGLEKNRLAILEMTK
jgi:hypothetical protein